MISPKAECRAMIFCSVVLCLLLGGCKAATSSAHDGSNQQLASLVEDSSYTDSICRNIKADDPEDFNADHHLDNKIDLAGVTVTLHDESGALVATTLTDSFGNYCFYQLALGNNLHVIVEENNPANDIVVSGADEDEAKAFETDKSKLLLRKPQSHVGQQHFPLEKLAASLSTETHSALHPELEISTDEVDRLEAEVSTESRDLVKVLSPQLSSLDSSVSRPQTRFLQLVFESPLTTPPTKPPTRQPTRAPTKPPTSRPTTRGPTRSPTKPPTKAPTRQPTHAPTKPPTGQTPTSRPTTRGPTTSPTKPPTKAPTRQSTPAPTKPPQTSPTSCTCTTPKEVPSECEVKSLIELLEIAVSGQHRLSAQWLRLSFHDAGTFNKAVPEGGANGCLMNFPDMRLQDENGHLDVAINTLEKIRDNWEQLVTTCIKISSADIIQFAGVFATVRQTGPVPGLTTDKISQLLTFKWGRPDEVNCNTKWTLNLPGFQLGTDPEDLPLRCKHAGGEIRKKMINRNGFTTKEATALIGAHTIGLTRNVFGGGLAAPWVASGEDSATPTGPVFDNAYFDFLKNKIVAKSITDFDKDTAPFTNMFPTWVQTTSPTKLNYLDTDLILAFPRPVNWTIPDYHLHTTAFVKNNEFFLTTFRNAQTKMGMLGVTANVTVPVPCSMCPSFSDPVDANAVLKLVSDLGTATATADSSLAAQQDANKDQLLVQTTTVVLTSSTTAFVSA